MHLVVTNMTETTSNYSGETPLPGELKRGTRLPLIFHPESSVPLTCSLSLLLHLASLAMKAKQASISQSRQHKLKI